MKKYFLSILFLIVLTQGWTQIRLSTLVLKPKEVFELKNTDILVVDTLIMQDSSKIVLNKTKSENYIHAKQVIIGKGCLIDGEIASGKSGKAGKNGITSNAPCSNGGPGANGLNGQVGPVGITLSLYLTHINVEGSLMLNLDGGDGGDGGKGGNGGGGGSGTTVCLAGNGGHGGNGGNGALGGQGGTLNIHCKECFDLHLLIGEKIIIRNYGGFGGLAGSGGFGGQAGLGPSPTKDGRNGAAGKHGIQGRQGKRGYIYTFKE